MKILFVFCLCFVTALALANNGRIIGGQVAYSGEFPFVSALYVTRESGTFFCSGALISEEWILTAGACVDGALSITIVLGTVKLDSTESSVYRVASTTTVLHPEFDASTLENDIGLIQLPAAVELTTRIRPVFLPENPLEDGEAGITLGWGKTSDDETGLSNTLNYVTLWSLSDSDCKSTYGDQIVGNLVCFAGTDNQGTCQGDSGSPVVQRVVNSGTAIIGISSFVSSNGCGTNPSGYTKVFEYVDWIRETTGLE